MYILHQFIELSSFKASLKKNPYIYPVFEKYLRRVSFFYINLSFN